MLYSRQWTRCFEADFVEGESQEVKLGLTKNQREWVKRAGALYWHTRILGKDPEKYHQHNNKAKCLFPVYKVDQWGDELACPCGGSDIHIHHIIPKRYAFETEGLLVDNDPRLLIPLCTGHHIGDGYKGSLDWHNDIVPVVHPDIAWAKRNYRGKEKPTSFDKVFEGRGQRVEQNLTYWNTDFDQHLLAIADEMYWLYLNTTGDSYPINHKNLNS